MADIETVCWKCGAALVELLLPLSRTEECPSCGTDLHVCRMCRFYDTSVGNACQEPVADFVSNKTRANFCGYLELRVGAGASESSIAANNDLEALFGLSDGDAEGSPSDSDSARAGLNDLFGLDDSTKDE